MITPQQIFYIIISIVCAHFVVSRLLSYLNLRNQQQKLPEDAKDIYSEEQYEKSQRYMKERSIFGLFSETVSFILLLGVLFLDGFAFVDNFVRAYAEHSIIQGLLFFGIIWLVYEVVSLPFELYSIFVIEQKFGFNTMTTQIYITDKIKSMLLSVIIGGVLLSLIIWLYLIFDTKFWLFALLVITGFSVFMSLFYTQLIVPLFNKLTPLEEGELKTAISAFAKKVAFPLHGISIIDNSKRSTKSNAYFTGFGRKKRIVLFDTLIQNHTTDELVAVLAHEIGHYKKKHIQLGLMLGIFQTGMLLFILSLMLSEPIFQFAIGVNVPSFHSALIVFGLLYTPFSFILGVFGNTLSRYNEYAADKFAGEKYSQEALRKALVKLSGDNLSNLTPHPWYVKVNYSHPPLLPRLAALNRIKE